MSAEASSAQAASATAPPQTEACPLCGARLESDQEWCLRCGAAARTRLAAAPAWRAPLVAMALVAALALGVIAAGLVKLAGDSGPAPAAVTRTVTTGAAGAAIPGAGGAAPSTTSSPTGTGTTGGALTTTPVTPP